MKTSRGMTASGSGMKNGRLGGLVERDGDKTDAVRELFLAADDVDGQADLIGLERVERVASFKFEADRPSSGAAVVSVVLGARSDLGQSC